MGPVQSRYESGNTDAMLNAFNREIHRAFGQCGSDKDCMRHPPVRKLSRYVVDRTRWVLQQPGSVERLEAAAVRSLERLTDTDGTGKLAKECPVLRASDLIRDRVERRRMEQTKEKVGVEEQGALTWQKPPSTGAQLSQEIAHTPPRGPRRRVFYG